MRSRETSYVALVAGLFALVHVTPAPAGDIYDHVDGRGGRTFTNAPTSSSYERIDLPPAESASARRSAGGRNATGSPVVRHRPSSDRTWGDGTSVTRGAPGCTTTFTYDKNNNLTSKTSATSRTTFKYDQENRLLERRTVPR